VLLSPKTRLLFIGDSITDCGRKRPVGEGDGPRALGHGYVSLLQAAIFAAYPDYALQILNTGVSGDTVHDLRARWTPDVLSLRPDWLSIFIGINDVWKHCAPWGEVESANGLDESIAMLDELVVRTQPRLSGLILMTPYYLQPERTDPTRQAMDRYGAGVRRLAEQRGAVLVDTQAAFDRVMSWIDPFELAEDRVHVGQTGHLVLARAVLDALGFDWSRIPPSLGKGER